MEVKQEKEFEKMSSLTIGVDAKLGLGENILYGFQHVLVLMLAPLVTPIIFASVFQWDFSITAYLMAIMLLGAGLETLVQAKVLKLPVAQAQHIVFIAAMIPAIYTIGPVMTWVGLLVVSFITILLVIPFKRGLIGRFLPYVATPVVLGPLFIVMSVGLARASCVDLIFPPDYVNGGYIVSSTNLILAGIAMFIPLIISFLVPKGILRYASVLWGVLIAIIVAGFMGEIDFAKVAAAPWFISPKAFWTLFEGNMGRPIAFTWNFIPVVLILFIAELSNVLDTMGCYQATANLVGQKMSSERANRGLFVETTASFFSTIFGNIPCTSFSQNLGVLSLSRVGAKSIMIAGGILLMLIGLFFKFGVFFTVIPWAIYGGALIVLFGTILVVGIQMIVTMDMTETNKLIVGFSTFIGIAFAFVPQEVAQSFPLFYSFFIGNPIGSTVVIAVILNLIFVHWLKSPGK
jgi:xanthine/uracil permease